LEVYQAKLVTDWAEEEAIVARSVKGRSEEEIASIVNNAKEVRELRYANERRSSTLY